MNSPKVLFLTIATNKYTSFVENLYSSIETYFENKNWDLLVFTNTELPNSLENKSNIKTHYISHTPWPMGTLLRYHFYLEMIDEIKKYDYVYHIDSDMKFVSSVGDEIFGTRVCVNHPGYYNRDNIKTYDYERNEKSAAYVSYDDERPKPRTFYQNCFQGGSSKEFILMLEMISKAIEFDLKNNHIALVHDESYMNKYMLYNPPDVILHSGYAYPELWNIPFEKKIVHIHKNHDLIRQIG